MIAWDTGIEVTGEGSADLLGRYVRFHFTTIPGQLTHNNTTPIRWRSLGITGYVTTEGRTPGGNIIYADQVIDAANDLANQVYWILTNGTVAVLHRGVEVPDTPPIACRLYRSSDAVIPDNVSTPVDWETASYDPFGMWAASPNPSRLVIPTSGIYRLMVQAAWATNGAGRRSILVYGNAAFGVAYVQTEPLSTSAFTVHQLVGDYEFTAGDYLEVQVYQNSGGDLNLVGDGIAYSTWAALARLS